MFGTQISGAILLEAMDLNVRKVFLTLGVHSFVLRDGRRRSLLAQHSFSQEGFGFARQIEVLSLPQLVRIRQLAGLLRAVLPILGRDRYLQVRQVYRRDLRGRFSDARLIQWDVGVCQVVVDCRGKVVFTFHGLVIEAQV